MPNITAEQIRDYTALAVRHSELVAASGSGWRPEYAAEMEELEKKLAEMKKEMFEGEKDTVSPYITQNLENTKAQRCGGLKFRITEV